MIVNALRTGVAKFRRVAVLGAMLLAIPASVALADRAAAHPKPAAVQIRWQLEFEPGELRLYEDELDHLTYWYFTYKVTNRTRRTQVWAPSFDLFTDAGEILSSGREVPTRVVNDIMAMLKNPLIEDQNAIIGDLLDGRQHAKEGLVVWPARRLQVNEISLFIAGISGETARVRNPISGKQSILRKTLERKYLIRGNARLQKGKPVELVEEGWIMR